MRPKSGWSENPLSASQGALNWKRIFFLAMLFWLIYTYPTEGRGEIALNIYPKAVVASPYKRATIRVEWRIPRHPDNRRWAFGYESDNGDGSSSQGTMDGDNSHVVFPICTRENERPCFRKVAPGTYQFYACVYRAADGKVLTFCDRYTLEVKGGEQ